MKSILFFVFLLAGLTSFGQTATDTLSASVTTKDGVITSTRWEKISGPNNFAILTPNSTRTVVTGLIVGVYVFQLTATNSFGISTSKQVEITVLPPYSAPVIIIDGPIKREIRIPILK